MSVDAMRAEPGQSRPSPQERKEREALLRFLDWAEGVAADLHDGDAVEGLRAAATAVRRGLPD